MDPGKALLTWAMLVSALISGNAQFPPTCSGITPPISSCAGACIHCNFNGYASSTNKLDVGGTPPPGFCTAIVHHIQYVGFAAGSPNLTIRVDVLACDNVGIEIGLYKSDDCGVFELVSNCNTFMPPGSYNFSNTVPLDVGCHYYMVIDGNLPSNCDFTVSVLAGSTVPPPVSFNGPVTGPTHVCVGDEYDYSVSHNGACHKMWNVTGGTITSGDMEDDVSVGFNTPGVARICFTGENICNPPNEICKDVIVHPNPIEVEVGPFEVCEGELYLYNGRPYPQGIHEIRHVSPYGCDSIEYLEVIGVPDVQEQLNPSVCFPNCYQRSGQQFCNPGYHRLVVPSSTPPFCDSIFDIYLNSIVVKGHITKSGDLSCGDTLVTLRSDSTTILGRGITFYRWIDPLGRGVGDKDSLVVNEPGRYCLEVTVEGSDGTMCFDQVCIEVLSIDEDPELQLDTNIALCVGDTLPLSQIPVYEINGYGGQITYHSGPPIPGNRIRDYVVVGDTIRLWASFSSGQCSDELYFEIIASPSPEILVTDTLTFCEGDTIRVMDIQVLHTSLQSGVLTFHEGPPFDTSTEVSMTLTPGIGDSLYVRSTIDQCDDVELVPMDILSRPVGDFMLSADTICLGDTVTLFYQGDLDDDLNYLWSWDNSIPSALGDQDYRLLFPDSGRYEIELIVDNGYCTSEPYRANIFVQKPLDPLQLTCLQDDSTIIFQWELLAGTTGYTVTDLTGIGTGQRLNDTSYRFSGLMNRDSVRIRVVAIGPKYCGPVMAEIFCKAVYCPQRMVTIDSVGPICIDASTMPITLTADISGNPSAGEFIWEGPGITDSLTGIFDPVMAGEGRHVIECIFENEDCIWRSSIIIQVLSTPISVFMIDNPICIDSVAYLRFTGMAQSTANYILEADGATVSPGNDPLDRILSWSTPGPKTVTLQLEQDGCLSEKYTVEVEVDESPDPIMADCNNTKNSVTLTINGQRTIGNYQLTVLSGQIADQLNDTTYMVDQLMPGEEVVFEILGQSNNSCSDVMTTVRCTTETCRSIDIQLVDTLSFCDNELISDFLIPFDIPGQTPDGMVLWQGAAVIDPEVGEIDLLQLTSGYYTYYLSYTEEVCDYKDTLTIEINQTPDANAGEDVLLTCNDTLHTVSGLDDAGLMYTWQPIIPTTGGVSLFSEEGTYTLTVRNMETGCTARDTLIVVQEDNVPSDMELEVVSGACDSSDLGSMRVDTIIGGLRPYQFSFENGPFTSQRIYTGLQAGSYVIRVMDANGCELERTFTIEKGDPIEVELGPDREIYAGTTIRVDAQTNKTPAEITWTPNDELSCTDCLFPSLRPDSTILLTITVVDENGCRDTDDVLIKVKYRKVFVPNIFSPNGDGLNDILAPLGNEEVEEVKVFAVYDRWGESVHRVENIGINDPELGWDGSFHGERLNPGVYVVHLVVRYGDGEIETFTGDVTLID